MKEIAKAITDWYLETGWVIAMIIAFPLGWMSGRRPWIMVAFLAILCFLLMCRIYSA